MTAFFNRWQTEKFVKTKKISRVPFAFLWWDRNRLNNKLTEKGDARRRIASFTVVANEKRNQKSKNSHPKSATSSCQSTNSNYFDVALMRFPSCFWCFDSRSLNWNCIRLQIYSDNGESSGKMSQRLESLERFRWNLEHLPMSKLRSKVKKVKLRIIKTTFDSIYSPSQLQSDSSLSTYINWRWNVQKRESS